jgi:LysM repeat protein
MNKIFIFTLVIAFHMVILGIVYVSTRDGDPDYDSTKNESVVDTSNKEVGVGTKENIVIEEPIKHQNPTPPVNKTPPTNNTNATSSKVLVHIVAKGDFLGKIAEKYSVSSKEILDLNNITDPDKILLGQKLKIPVK